VPVRQELSASLISVMLSPVGFLQHKKKCNLHKARREGLHSFCKAQLENKMTAHREEE